MRIAIIGAGGVGGYLGAKLWKAGNDVIFAARGSHLAAMKLNGLKLESPDGDIIVQSLFAETLSGELPVDLVIMAVKSFDTQAASKRIKHLIHDTTLVLSIQNGVENEEIIASEVGANHVIGGVAYIYSTISAPGIIQHTGTSPKFKFGELDGAHSDRCRQIESTFRQAGIDSEAIPAIQKLLWEKWIFICGLGGMTAYTRKSIGEILADTPLFQMLENVVSEAATTARRKINDQFSGIEEKIIAHYRRLPSSGTSSMYYDVTHLKRIELNALNGAVVRFGRELSLNSPANEEIVQTLQQYS